MKRDHSDRTDHTLAAIIAASGLLVTAWDRDDVATCADLIERLRVQLTAWHSPRDGDVRLGHGAPKQRMRT